MGVKIFTSQPAAGRVATSRVRLRELTRQLSTIAGKREHNRGKAKNADNNTEPKHGHGKSSSNLVLYGFGAAPYDSSGMIWITVPSPLFDARGGVLPVCSSSRHAHNCAVRSGSQSPRPKEGHLAALHSREPPFDLTYLVMSSLCAADGPWFRRDCGV